MPILGSFGAGSAKGYGLTAGGGQPVLFDYLVLAGGGGGGGGGAGSGAGGGGLRTNFPGGTQEELAPGIHTITVGTGGSPGPANNNGFQGNPSTFGTITAAGGGRGVTGGVGGDGGAGGGGNPAGGNGNTPPFSPPQGAPGFLQGNPPAHPDPNTGGGGGGGGPTGSGGPTATRNINGGSGTNSSISGSPTTYSGGGGGGTYGMTWPGGSGGPGGGGNGSNGEAYNATPGTNGLGGGGGGGGGGMTMNSPGGAGGNGKIILRTPLTAIVSAAPGSNTVSSQPDHQLITFNVSGTLTVDGYNE